MLEQNPSAILIALAVQKFKIHPQKKNISPYYYTGRFVPFHWQKMSMSMSWPLSMSDPLGGHQAELISFSSFQFPFMINEIVEVL